MKRASELVITYKTRREFYLKETVKTVSSILTSDLKATWKSLKRKQAHQMAEEIMSTVEEGAFLLRTQNVSTFEFFEKNVALSVKVISAGESNVSWTG